MEDAGGGLDENDNAIVRLANQIIADAYRQGASDIHVEPYGEKRETLVRFRVDGDCFEYMKIPQSYRRAIVSRLKIMASLDIAERRKPQDGKIKFKLSENKEIELRVATIPTAGYNEDVVMRLLAASEPLPLDKMGFSDRNLAAIKVIAAKPYGIILCVGPTGSGKPRPSTLSSDSSTPRPEDLDGGRPRRNHTVWAPAGSSSAKNRLHVCRCHARVSSG